MKISENVHLFSLDVLRRKSNDVSTLFERLSSGLRINKGADDPTDMGISTSFRSRISGLDTAIANIQDGLSMLQTMDGALSELQDMLQRGRELAVRASNDATLTADDIAKMQAEVDQLLEEIDRLTETTTFNSKKLLDGGSGASTELETQGDWAAGTFNIDEIDIDTSPDDVLLKVMEWTLDPEYNNPVGDDNKDNICLYIRNAVDNGDGTYTAEMVIRGERVGNGGNLAGYINLDPAAVIGATSGGVSTTATAGQIQFNTTAGTAMNDLESFTFTAPANSRWELQLTARNNEKINMYWGSEWRGDTRPATFYSGYFTDITPTAIYETQAIDTGQPSGAKAVLSYNIDKPGGTNYQVRLYESATGAGGWTALQLVGNGDSFEFTQQFLKVEITMTSTGIEYGSPVLSQLGIQILEDTVLQIGSDNNPDLFREYLSPIDTHTAALGISQLSLSSLTDALAIMDTQGQWLSGTSNLVNMDILSNPGTAQLEKDITTTASPDKANTPSLVISIDSAVARADGSYDYVMSVRHWGLNPAGSDDAILWNTIFSVSDSSGTVDIDEITCQSCEGTAGSSSGDSPAGVVPTVPGGGGDFRDGVWGVDSSGAYWGVDRLDGTLAGTYSAVYADMATGGQMDGYSIRFTAGADAVFNINFQQYGIENGGVGRVQTAARSTDIYFGSDLIGNQLSNQTISHALGEYVASGSFETTPVLVGANASAFVNGVANSGNSLITVEASPDGIGGWTQIVAPGSGITSFTTPANSPYIRVLVDMTSTTATLATPAGSYQYTASTSPVITLMSVNSNVSPIEKFDAAITAVSDIRAEIGITAGKLMHMLDDLENEIINVTAANSRIEDTDFAQSLTELAKAQIMASSATSMNDQHEIYISNFMTLLNAADGGRSVSG